MDATLSIPVPPIEYIHLVGSLTESDFHAAAKGVADMVRQHAPLSNKTRFLDVGCGCGRVARELTRDPIKSYKGFDRHRPMIEWAQENITPIDPRFTFDFADVHNVYTEWDNQPRGAVPATAFKFPYDNESFDTILLSSVFTHMPKEEIEAYSRELNRVLAKDGAVIASVFFTQNASNHLGDFAYDKTEIEEVFSAAGLAPQHITDFGQSWYRLTKGG